MKEEEERKEEKKREKGVFAYSWIVESYHRVIPIKKREGRDRDRDTEKN